MDGIPAQDALLARLDALARAALPLWPLPTGLSLRLVNLSENATYRVDAPDGRAWALRLHRAGYHSDAAIRSELAWAAALRAAGVVPTPVPVAGRDGALLQVPILPDGFSRRAVLFDWEAGREPGSGEDLRAPFERLGEISARMHAHARAWPRPDGFTRFIWDVETSIGDRPHWGRWQDGVAVDGDAARLFGAATGLIRTRLARFGQGPDRFGLVHADLRLANLLVDGQRVKVIDFDDCGFSWFLYDAATAVSFFEDAPQVPALLDRWVAGYRRVAPLSGEEIAEIPTFVMLRRLLLVAWIGSHRETALAREMGAAFTRGTVRLARAYLSRMA